jgi:hypothetical protein
MTPFLHRLSRTLYVLIVLAAIISLCYAGLAFYKLPLEERFYSPDYAALKPSGIIGHGLGIFGTLILLIGLFSYMARKRLKVFSRLGTLKYWLEFHIFMCTLGPILILFHTSFKFGGLVAVSFWSLVIVVASGVIGRFIYLQIPHSVEGRELTMEEVQNIEKDLEILIKDKYGIDISELNSSSSKSLEKEFKNKNLPQNEFRSFSLLINNQRKLSKRIQRLEMMQSIFRYWHVAHLPFALIMLVIMIIHVIVALTFGYKWIL